MNNRLPFHDDEAFASWAEVSERLAPSPVDAVLNTLVLGSVAAIFVVGLFAGPPTDWYARATEPTTFRADPSGTWQPAELRGEALSWSCPEHRSS